MISLGGLGRPSLWAALAFTILAGGLFGVALLRRRRDLLVAGKRATATAAGATVAASVALLSALFARDFSFEYVASYSSRSLSGPYTFAALWGGMEGSLLFWTVLLAGCAAVALLRDRRASTLTAWTGIVLAGVSAFFLALLLGPADPFTKLAQTPADGSGLNPLLQSPGMVIHPPLLYMGFVGFSVPFAFGIAALIAKRLDDDWFVRTRRWTLFAWSSLSVGIVLGGAWAYTELGWGGYWAWDPVENASFLPWLTATAYLHSVVIQEKRRMFKAWNISLILLTYVLAIFGTFLTRSGLLSSIHTFTEGPIGKWFLPFLALMLIGGLALIALRIDHMRSEHRLDGLLSRESAFLLNNVLFLAAAVTVLWGTIYPVVAEAVTGVRLSVGPPYFNSVFLPIAFALIALTGLGPLISWRRMRPGSLAKLVRAPLAIGATVVVVCALFGVRSAGALTAFGLSAFTAATTVIEVARGSRVHRRREGLGWGGAVARTFGRNRRRYGGYVVHLGVALIVLGLAGAAFKTERSAELDRDGTMSVGSYTLSYDGLANFDTPEKERFVIDVAVDREGDPVGHLYPERNVHLAQGQPQSEVAIRSTPVEDLYVVVTSLDADGTIVLRAFVNPLTWWVWAGAVVMLAGMLVIMSGPLPMRAAATAPVRRTEPAVAAR